MHINFYSRQHIFVVPLKKKRKIKRQNVFKTFSWKIQMLTVAENGDKILFYG